MSTRMAAAQKAAIIERDRRWGATTQSGEPWPESIRNNLHFMAGYDRRVLLKELDWREAPPEDHHRELTQRFWRHYRCMMVGCEVVEQNEHGGGRPGREMTADELSARIDGDPA